MLLTAHVPVDRLVALAAERELPDRARGVALFADLVGSTHLAEMLLRQLGPQRGVEELTCQLNRVYEVLVSAVERYGGSVISFSGDAITCWFDEIMPQPGHPAARRAVAAAVAMQHEIAAFAPVRVADSELAIAVKIAIAGGPIRRFAIGDPALGRIDVLAGATLDLLNAMESLARRGDTLIDAETATVLANQIAVGAWRTDETTGTRAASLSRLLTQVQPTPWIRPLASPAADALARPWVIPAVAARLVTSTGAARAPLLAEIRRTVALFLSFSGIDYDQDEDAPVYLDAFIRRVQAIAAAYGGAMLQLMMGDKGSYLYIVFGAPTANDDAAANAVGAARALLGIPAQVGFVRDLRIGIAQGQMYCGAYGATTRCTYGVIGDATNVAARLMVLAPPGEIRCDDRVYQAARRRWAFTELRSVNLKGKRDLVQIFTPIGTRVAHGVTPTDLLPIGRSAELARLDTLLDQLVAGEGHLLLLSGEAGVGKSLLAGILARRALGRQVGLLQGAAVSVELQTPYRAWRDLLEGFFGIGPINDRAARCNEVRALVAATTPKLVQRTPLLNDVLHLDLAETPLTSALDSRLRQESLLGLIVALLRARMSDGPLLLLIDDAQWLDDLSWLLTVGVARALLTHGLLMAVVLRPVDVADAATDHLSILAHLPHTEGLHLEGLHADAIVELVSRRLGVSPSRLPPALADLVRERAVGNPFFAEEIVNNLRDRELIRVDRVDGVPTCLVSPDLTTGQAPLPHTIESLVLARIDRLPAEQQLLLKVAAVIGRSFSERPLHATLRRYIQIERPALASHLDNLTRHDLTLPEVIEPELTYIFKHLITHNVAYETLLFGQRAEIHCAVAAWYERSYTGRLEPFYPLLAYHYRLANDQEREARYARLAGEQAAALCAHEDALIYLSRALQLTSPTNNVGRYEILLVRERVYEMLARSELQASDVRALEVAAERLGDDWRQAKAARRRANFAERVSDYAAGTRAAERATAIAAALGDHEGEAEGYVLTSRMLLKQGRSTEVREYLERARALLDDAGPSRLSGHILHALGVTQLTQSDEIGAKVYFTQAAALFHRLGDRRSEAVALLGLNAVASYSGNYTLAQELAAQALELHRAVGDRQGEAQALGNMADDYLAVGDYLAARRCMEESLEIFLISDSWEGKGWALNNLGEVALALGNYAEAEDRFSQALTIFRTFDLAEFRSGAVRFLGLLAYLRGDHTASLAQANEALRIAIEIGWVRGQSYALMVRGHALCGLGRLTMAEAAYNRARALREELSEPVLLLETCAGLARVALIRGEAAKALALIEPILAHLAGGDLSGTDEPAHVELICYTVLRATGDPRTLAVLAAAVSRLRQRANRISDESLRAMFLTGVTAHRALLDTGWEHERGGG